MAGSNLWQFPSGLPGGDLMPFMSARRRREILDTAFEQLGGIPKLVSWAERNDENYGTFFKAWSRGELRVTASDSVAAGEGDIETILARLDAGEHAKVVNGDPPP